MSELLNCPFCGGEAHVRIMNPNDPNDSFSHFYYRAGCDTAMCPGNYVCNWIFSSDKEAIEAWNTRADTCGWFEDGVCRKRDAEDYALADALDTRAELTVEKCTKFLKANGYTVTKRDKLPPLLPCKCGRSSRATWVSGEGYTYVCNKCGLKVKGKTKRELRLNWNEAVSE